MAGGSQDDDSSSRNVCKFCNKPAVNKIAKCTECQGIVHRYCCDKRNIEVGVNNATNCCIAPGSFDNIAAVEESSIPVEVPDHPPDADTTVNQLRLEINYLTKLLTEKQRIIQDKCTIIADKEEIIELQREQLKLYAAHVKNLESLPPISSNRKNLNRQRANSAGDSGVDNDTHTLSQPEDDNHRKQSSGRGITVNSSEPGSVAGIGGNREDAGGTHRELAVTARRDSRRGLAHNSDMNGVARVGTIRQRNLITGTAEAGNQASDVSFASAVRRAWLYVGRVNPQVTKEDVNRYLEQKFAGRSFIVEMLPKRDSANSIAFKVAADMEILDDLNKPETWPKGVQVKRFRFFRERTITQHSP